MENFRNKIASTDRKFLPFLHRQYQSFLPTRFQKKNKQVALNTDKGVYKDDGVLFMHVNLKLNSNLITFSGSLKKR